MKLFDEQQHEFAGRHIGTNETEKTEMLKTIGINTLVLDKPTKRQLPCCVKQKSRKINGVMMFPSGMNKQFCKMNQGFVPTKKTPPVLAALGAKTYLVLAADE